MGKRTNDGDRSASDARRTADGNDESRDAGGQAGGRERSSHSKLPGPGADSRPIARSKSRRGNKPFQRSMNRALVLNDLRRAPGASRAELADRLAFDRSTISNITGELLAAGLIEEIAGSRKPASPNEKPGPRAGRRAVGLRIADERLCALGIEIDARGYRAIVRDNSGSIRYREEGQRDFVADTAAGIAETVGSVASRAGAHGVRVIGAGCAVPGYISPADARIVHSRELGVVDAQMYSWSRVDVRQRGADAPRRNNDTRGSVTGTEECDSATGGINTGTEEWQKRAADIPIVYDNDANCCAWGELHARRTSERENNPLFVLARVGAEHLGIGLGLAVDGAVRSGATHSAGELYSSEWRGDDRTQLSIAARDLSGIRENASVRRAFLIELLSNLIPVVSVLDPASVVFGGVLREYYDEALGLVASEFSTGYLGHVASRMRRSALAEDEMAAGAAALVLESLFRIPRYGTGDEATSIRWEDVANTLGEPV